MKKLSLLLTLVVLSLLSQPVFATTLSIEFTGVDIVYEGGEITASADPLASMDFFIDGVLDNSMSTLAGDTLLLDLFFGAPLFITTEGEYSLSGGDFDLTMNTGGLSLTTTEAFMDYNQIAGTADFIFVGAAASIDSQALPFGLVIDDPVSVSLSTQINSFVTDVNGIVSFDASGTGEVTGTAPVPEPATMLLFGVGLVGLAGSRIGKKK